MFTTRYCGEFGQYDAIIVFVHLLNVVVAVNGCICIVAQSSLIFTRTPQAAYKATIVNTVLRYNFLLEPPNRRSLDTCAIHPPDKYILTSGSQSGQGRHLGDHNQRQATRNTTSIFGHILLLVDRRRIAQNAVPPMHTLRFSHC